MCEVLDLRERRRAKILNHSEDRLKKLLGSNRTDNECIKKNSMENCDADENSSKHRTSEHFRNPDQPRDEPVSTREFPVLPEDKTFQDIMSNLKREEASNLIADTATNKDDDDDDDGKKDKFREHLKFRFLFMLLAGAIVRIMLESPLKVAIFRENAIYQFILLQTIFISYLSLQRLHRASNYGNQCQVVSHLLRMSGMAERTRDAVLFLYTFAQIATKDFCAYMFTFAVVHYLRESPVSA